MEWRVGSGGARGLLRPVVHVRALLVCMPSCKPPLGVPPTRLLDTLHSASRACRVNVFLVTQRLFAPLQDPFACMLIDVLPMTQQLMKP